MAQVSLRQLTKEFDETVAVADLDLEVADGEFVVLVGPSGSGKTTALRLVAGLEQPTRGSIIIGDRDVTDVPPRDRDIAMVFQNYALYPHMTAFQNMAFGLQVRGYPKIEIDERVRDAAEILGIRELLHRRPGQLSGGQRQRTAVGRAIVRHPQAFLFDEPLSNLDASLRVEMRAELSQLHRRLGATILYVTHDQVEAMTMGQRIAVMNEGRLQQYAEPLEVYRTPANRFVAGFIGSPSINFFEGELHRAEPDCTFRGASFQLAVPGAGTLPAGATTLGIRPEDLRLSDAGTFSALVRVVEPVGSEMFIHLTTEDGTRIVARAAADARVAVDQRVAVEIPPHKIHLFRRDTGDRIGP
jgi:multiple sugar transport system ATP-binding protein